MKLHKRSSQITRSASSASIARRLASSVSHSRCVALAVLLLTTASAPQGLASSYYIFGEVYTFSGYPLNSYYHDDFSGTHPVQISDTAHVEGSSPSGFPVERYAANVFAYGGSGLARLSLDSSFRRDFPRDERPNENFQILRSTGEVRVTINDLIISGPATGSVSTRLNLHVGGTMDASSSFSALPDGIFGASGFTVGLLVRGIGFVGDGYFELKSTNGNAPVVSHESGWLTGFDGDAILTSDSFSVQLDTPFTVEFSLSSQVQAGMRDTESGLAFAFLRFDNTLSFNTEGDVFNLPPGYTANSVSAGIVNNRFVAVPEPTTGALLAGAATVAFFHVWRQRRRSRYAA